MSAHDSWVPRGIDLEKLEAAEREICRRLVLIRQVLRCIEVFNDGAPPRVSAARTSTRGKFRYRQVMSILEATARSMHPREIYAHLRHIDSNVVWRNPAAILCSWVRRYPAGLIVRIAPGIYVHRSCVKHGC